MVSGPEERILQKEPALFRSLLVISHVSSDYSLVSFVINCDFAGSCELF